MQRELRPRALIRHPGEQEGTGELYLDVPGGEGAG